MARQLFGIVGNSPAKYRPAVRRSENHRSWRVEKPIPRCNISGAGEIRHCKYWPKPSWIWSLYCLPQLRMISGLVESWIFKEVTNRRAAPEWVSMTLWNHQWSIVNARIQDPEAINKLSWKNVYRGCLNTQKHHMMMHVPPPHGIWNFSDQMRNQSRMSWRWCCILSDFNKLILLKWKQNVWLLAVLTRAALSNQAVSTKSAKKRLFLAIAAIKCTVSTEWSRWIEYNIVIWVDFTGQISCSRDYTSGEEFDRIYLYSL